MRVLHTVHWGVSQHKNGSSETLSEKCTYFKVCHELKEALAVVDQGQLHMALTGDGVQDGEELLHQLRQEGPLQLRPTCTKGWGSVGGWHSAWCPVCHGRGSDLSLVSMSILPSFFWRWFQYFLRRGCFLNSSSWRPWAAAWRWISTPHCTPSLAGSPSLNNLILVCKNSFPLYVHSHFEFSSISIPIPYRQQAGPHCKGHQLLDLAANQILLLNTGRSHRQCAEEHTQSAARVKLLQHTLNSPEHY